MYMLDAFFKQLMLKTVNVLPDQIANPTVTCDLFLPVFFFSPPPACQTPPVNYMDRVVLMQVSWNKCLFLSFWFFFKYFLLH